VNKSRIDRARRVESGLQTANPAKKVLRLLPKMRWCPRLNSSARFRDFFGFNLNDNQEPSPALAAPPLLPAYSVSLVSAWGVWSTECKFPVAILLRAGLLDVGTISGLRAGKGSKKKHAIIFLQKVHVKNFFQTNRQKFRCQFFLVFFLIAVSGVSQRLEFKNTRKKMFCKKIVSKSFYKRFDQKSKTDFFSI
jgi:hypothetical protein